MRSFSLSRTRKKLYARVKFELHKSPRIGFQLVAGSGGNPFISHSLSWSRKSDISPNGTMYAKVWTPEDPRTTKNETTFE